MSEELSYRRGVCQMAHFILIRLQNGATIKDITKIADIADEMRCDGKSYLAFLDELNKRLDVEPELQQTASQIDNQIDKMAEADTDIPF